MKYLVYIDKHFTGSLWFFIILSLFISILVVRFGFSYSKQLRYVGLMIFYIFSRSPTTRLSFAEAANGVVFWKEMFENSQEKTCGRVSFLIKLQHATLLKKRLWHLCFPVNSAKLLRTSSLQNTSGWLLLLL